MTRVTAPGPFVRVTASQQSAHASSQRTEPAMPNRRGMFLRAGGMVCLLAITSVAAYAQTPSAIPPGPLTLEQVLALAEPKSETVAIAQAGIRRAEGDQIRARSGELPQLSLTASYDRALASEFEGVFDFSGPTCSPFALNPTAPIEARLAEIERAIDCGAVGGGGFFGSGSSGTNDNLNDLPFGRKNTFRVLLNFSQNLYSGGRNGAQQEVAALGHESAGHTLTTARGQLLFEVAQAYYDAVLSDRLVTIAAATLEQASATLKQTQVGFEAGTQPEFEVLRARVTRDNQSPVLIRQRANRGVAFLHLKQLLELPVDYPLELADALSDDSLPPSPAFAERVVSVEKTLRDAEAANALLEANVTLPERTAVDEAATTVRLREASLKLVEAQKKPSVSLNSSYGRIAYPDNGLPTFNRSNWTVGASMTVPILTGGRQRGDEAMALAELEQARSQRKQVEELAALDTRSAWAELIASRVAWEAMAGTIQQAQRAYQIANVRFTNGVSTQLELSDARLSLQQAEANRTVAARDLQVARARVALLPNLPVSAPSGSGVVPLRVPQPQSPSVPAPQQPQAGGQIRNASAQGAQTQVGLQ
jgi:outer membrane protein